jgi:hypothetical protein
MKKPPEFAKTGSRQEQKENLRLKKQSLTSAKCVASALVDIGRPGRRRTPHCRM